MAQPSLGKLVIQLEGDVGRLQADMQRMQSIVESSMSKVDKAANDASESVKNVGKAANDGVKRAKGLDEVASQMDHLNFKTAGARRELLVLAHELSQGSWSRFGGSLMVLGERTDAMSLIFSKAGVTIAGVVGTIGLFVVAAAMGAKEIDHFNKSLLLTGNMAGVTAGSFDDLAKRIGESNRETVGHSREALQAVVSTGAFTRSELSAVTSAVLQHAKASGEDADKVAADYAKMRDGVAKWAEEHNRSMHYMSAATFDRIKALEEAGKTEQALMLNLETLNNRFAEESTRKLGYVERAWLGIKQAISGTWDAMKSIGRPDTTDDKIGKLVAQRAAASRPYDQQGTNSAPWTKANEAELTNLREMKRFEEAQASRQSVIDVQQQAAIKAGEALDQMRTQIDKNYAKAKEIRKLNRDFSDLMANPNSELLKGVKASGDAAGGYKFSGGAYGRMLEEINEKYRDKRGDQLGHAGMEAQLKPLQDAIKIQKDILDQREKFLTLYYKNGQISSDTFYSGQQSALEEHIDKARALYDQEIAIVQAYAAKTGDAEKKIEAAKRAQALADERDRTIGQDKAKLIEIDLEKTKTTDDYRLSVQKLTDELDKLEGRLHDNTLGEFDRTHDAIKKRIVAEGDPKAQATFNRLREVTEGQGKIQEVAAQGKQVMDSLAARQAEIDASVTMGVITQLEGMGKLGVARKAAYADLLQLDDKLTELLGTQELTAAQLDTISKFHTQVQTLGAGADVLKEKLSSAIGGEFANMMESLVNRTKSLKDAINDFAGSITRMLVQLAANSLAQKLFSTGGAAAGGSGGEGFMGMAMSFLSTMFGGGKASGGDVSRGKFYEVNENGPELLTVANRTYLMSGDNGHVTPMTAGGGGRSTVMHMNINVPPGTTRQTAQQQASAIMRQAQIAQARNA